MAREFVHEKHDLGLKRTDGTTLGLMLIRDRNDVPFYQVDDDEYISEVERGQSRAERELPPIIGDDGRSGYGLEVYDSADPKRYFFSKNIDLRFKGMAICSPKATGITIPANGPTVANADMELTTGWTNMDRSTNEVHGGTYSCRVNSGNDVSQDMTWTTDYQGATVRIIAWCWSSAGTSKFIIDDGVDTTEVTISNNSTWTQTTVKHKLNASATRLRIKFTNTTTNSFYVDDVTTPLWNTGNPVALMEFNDELYLANGEIISKLNSGGNGFIFRFNAPATITDLETFTDDKFYIAQGASDNYWYMSTAEAFTETDSEAKFFVAVGTTMWKGLTPRSIYSATDPTAEANWATVTTVDSTDYDILEMLTDGSTLVIKKEDRTFFLDDAGAVQILIGQTKHLARETQGRSSTEWQGKYYIGAGAASLIEYDGGTITWRSPSKLSTNLSEFDGRVQGLAGDEEWLFQAIDDGNNIQIMAGRLETIDTVTKWVLHPLVTLTLAGCETMFVSTIYQKRLWIASTSSSDSLYYIPLYTNYGDVVNDANRDFQTGGEWWTSWLYGGFKGDVKAFIRNILTMENTTSTIYWECHYQKLGDEAGGGVGWTKIADYKTSPLTTRFIPNDSGGAKPKKEWFRLKFVAITDDVLVTPILKQFDLRAILMPPRRRIIKALVYCADDILDKDGNVLEADATTIKAALEEAADATWPVEFYDIYGDTKNVRFLATPEVIRVIKSEKNKKPELAMRIMMQEITLN